MRTNAPYDREMVHVESVVRALRIIEALAASPAGLSETARRVNLPKSSVARLLSTLEQVEAVERDVDGRLYRLGPKVQRLSAAAGGPAQLAAFARPYLNELTRRTGEAAGVSIPDGYAVHYVDQTESSHPVQVRDWTGELIPMHVVPSGLVVMAHWPTEQIDRYLGRALERLTPNTMTDPDEIRRRLKAIREKGYVWVYEEFVEGINSVAAPVLEKNGIITAALHVHGPSYRFPGENQPDQIGEAVADGASRLSAALSR
jgi:DNA-binding IclR family transcriptional regulator